MIASTVSYILQLTAASSVFPIDEENFPLVKTIRLVVQSVKSVAAYIQAIRTQLQIKNYIKAKFDTRWNSTLTMLQSFIENKSDIYSLLKSNEQEQGVENMDLSVVNTLIQFLEPFQKVTKELEGEKESTIHKVYQYYCMLERSMCALPTDSLLHCSSF